MTFDDFNTLDRGIQRSLLIKRGVKIGSARSDDFNAILFALDSFYVEVLFDPEKNREVYIRCFMSTDCLEPYLKQIDISSLFE